MRNAWVNHGKASADCEPATVEPAHLEQLVEIARSWQPQADELEAAFAALIDLGDLVN